MKIVLVMVALAACGGDDGAVPGVDAGHRVDAVRVDARELDGPPDAQPDAPGIACTPEAQQLYVLIQLGSEAAPLLGTLDLESEVPAVIGQLTCLPFDVPLSMAIDRRATGWVTYADGSMYRFDAQTLACSRVDWQPTPDIAALRLSFVPTGPGSQQDRALFIGGQHLAPGSESDTTSMFGAFDLESLAPTTIGTAPGIPWLAGTVEGNVWAYSVDPFHAIPASMIRIDPETGFALDVHPTIADGYDSESFFAYGGYLWLISFSEFSGLSEVYKFHAANPGPPIDYFPAHARVFAAATSTCGA